MIFIFLEYCRQRHPLKLNAEVYGCRPFNGQSGPILIILVSAVA